MNYRIPFLLLLFVVKVSYGYTVNVTYGETGRMCEYSIRGPPFKELSCSDETCNNAIHTCHSGCPNGDPALGVDKVCYFNGVPVANQHTILDAALVEQLANVTTPCTFRVPPCGEGNCIRLISDSGSPTQTCGFFCPIPFSVESGNASTDQNSSTCVMKDCPTRTPSNYFLTLVTGENLAFSGVTSVNSAFVVKNGDKIVFQSQVVVNNINPIVNKGFDIDSSTTSVGIEVYNYNPTSKALDLIGRTTVNIIEVAPEEEEPSSHYLKDNGGADVGAIKLRRSTNPRACGSSGWCKKGFGSDCTYENCAQRMAEANANVPCGPECFQQVNFAGTLQTSCGPSCPQGYTTHESGQCVVVIEEEETDSTASSNKGLIIAFGVVLPIMVVLGVVVVVVTVCVLVRLNRKRNAAAK